MKIWIEVELNWVGYEYYTIAEEENLSLEKFKDIWNLWVKLSQEYYNTTIEYNFFPFDNSDDMVNEVVEYLKNQKEKYGFEINGQSPAFVWTHIHFFDKLSMPKDKLLSWVMSFIIENIDTISELWLLRLIKWHQIWWYWSHNHNHLWIETLKRRWYYLDIYQNTRDKNKYVPVFISWETSQWKPKSLELRIVPNDFVFNWKLIDLLKEIENKDIFRRELVSPIDFFTKLIDKYEEKVWIVKQNKTGWDWFVSYNNNTYKIPLVLTNIDNIDWEIQLIWITMNLTYYSEFQLLNNRAVSRSTYKSILYKIKQDILYREQMNSMLINQSSTPMFSLNHELFDLITPQASSSRINNRMSFIIDWENATIQEEPTAQQTIVEDVF